jgi:hypothetical protein
MNPDTIHLRRAVNLVAHIQDQGQDRAAAVAAHTHAAAVDIHRTAAAADPHRTAVADRPRTVAGAAIAIHIPAPVPTTDSGAARTLLVSFARPKQNERRTTNRRSFCA